MNRSIVYRRKSFENMNIANMCSSVKAPNRSRLMGDERLMTIVTIRPTRDRLRTEIVKAKTHRPYTIVWSDLLRFII